MNARRAIRHAVLLLALCATTAAPAKASEPWTADDTLAALADATPLARCIVRLEDESLDPYALGAAQEMGVAQLHPHGLYPLFLELGYTDVFSPYQSIQFLEWALDHGYGPQWSTWSYCT
jgi:hypothetical protein